MKTAVVTGVLVVAALSGLLDCVSGCSHYGSCPQPPVKQNFDIKSYMGKWFEYVRTPWPQGEGTKCVTANYTLNDDGSVTVLNGGIREQSIFGMCPWYTSDVAKGEAKPFDDKEPAKLGVRFSPYAPAGNYWVVETDYVTYAVVYSCRKYMEGLPFYTEVTWVLTRDRGVAPPGLVNIYQRLKDQGIDISKFAVTDHKGCPVWP